MINDKAAQGGKNTSSNNDQPDVNHIRQGAKDRHTDRKGCGGHNLDKAENTALHGFLHPFLKQDGDGRGDKGNG